jgi:hypothetical protein
VKLSSKPSDQKNTDVKKAISKSTVKKKTSFYNFSTGLVLTGRRVHGKKKVIKNNF